MTIVLVDRLEGVDAGEAELERKNAAQALREERVKQRQASSAHSAPLSWFIYGDRAEVPRAKPSLVPDGWQVAAKALGFWAVVAGLYYGPPYVTCWHMKKNGMFWSHTTMSTCMDERIAERDTWLDAVGKSIWQTI